MFKYQLWFLSLTTQPCLDSLQTLCSGLPETPGHSRDLASYSTSMLPSLDDTVVLDLLPNSWTSPNTSGILRVPGMHPKYLDKSMRWVQCMNWSQHLNPSQFWLSSAMYCSTSWHPAWTQEGLNLPKTLHDLSIVMIPLVQIITFLYTSIPSITTH